MPPPARTPDDRPAAGASPDPIRPDRVVGLNVLSALGRPPGLFEVVVRPLWGDYYRVNVLVGPDATAVRIAHSFFVRAGAGGSVRSAAPPVTRLYG